MAYASRMSIYWTYDSQLFSLQSDFKKDRKIPETILEVLRKLTEGGQELSLPDSLSI